MFSIVYDLMKTPKLSLAICNTPSITPVPDMLANLQNLYVQALLAKYQIIQVSLSSPSLIQFISQHGAHQAADDMGEIRDIIMQYQSLIDLLPQEDGRHQEE